MLVGVLMMKNIALNQKYPKTKNSKNRFCIYHIYVVHLRYAGRYT